MRRATWSRDVMLRPAAAGRRIDIIPRFCASCIEALPNHSADANEDFMSGTQDHAHDHDEAHEGPIKTPKQLAWAVFFAFVVPIIVIAMLASYVTTETKPSAGTEALEGQ